MSSLITNATIQIRKDTAGNWTSNNPTPADGELCRETDTGYLKIGDGSTAWTSLNYGSGAKFTDTIIALDGITVPILHVQDQKTSGTGGGVFNSGSWRTRDLNPIVTNTITGASLASNQITLPSGTYKINASAPAFDVSRHQAVLYNITDASNEVNGTSEYCSSASADTQNRSLINGIFTIADTKVFEIRHRAETTSSSNLGFGVSSGTGFTVDHETYTDVFIEKTG